MAMAPSGKKYIDASDRCISEEIDLQHALVNRYGVVMGRGKREKRKAVRE